MTDSKPEIQLGPPLKPKRPFDHLVGLPREEFERQFSNINRDLLDDLAALSRLIMGLSLLVAAILAVLVLVAFYNGVGSAGAGLIPMIIQYGLAALAARVCYRLVSLRIARAQNELGNGAKDGAVGSGVGAG